MSDHKAPVLFVSHHSSKLETAEHVERALNSKGVQCWIAPRDIEPGEQWDVAIREAIAKTDAMLLLFCSSSEKSRQVKRELILADQLGKAIIPLRLERIDPGQLSYHLADSQWIDWLEQRDGVIDRIAAKAQEFQGSEAFEPSHPMVLPIDSPGAIPPAPTAGAATPLSFDKNAAAAPGPELSAPAGVDQSAAAGTGQSAPSGTGRHAQPESLGAFGGTPVPAAPSPAHADPSGSDRPPLSDPHAPAAPRRNLLWLWFTLGGLFLVGLIGLAIWYFFLRGPAGITEEWFAGEWSDSPRCTEVYTFERDGDLRTSEGGRGTWLIEDGTTLVVKGDEGTVRRRITRVSDDEVDSSDGPAYRCD